VLPGRADQTKRSEEMTQSNDSIRKSVSEFYGKEVNSPNKSCCCGESAIPKGVAAKVAGYTHEELEALPPDAVVNSFGCGNPLAFSEVREGQVVLDLGSGAGIDILLAGKKVGPSGKAIGIDMTDEMIVRARENIAAAGLSNVEVRKGIIEALPVEDASVDWVISNCVINLSPEKPRVFAEISRVLKPGGRMSVSDIVAEDLPEWVRQSADLYGSCVAGAISEEEYLNGLRAAGLTDVEVKNRLVYNAAQIRAVVASEIPGDSCCGGTVDAAVIEKAVTSLADKVWSAKIHARKPLA
jgi:arsenite methyltransferase